jgi:putative transposase
VTTTVSNKSASFPLDRVNRQLRARALSMLWLGDFTYISAWQGFAYVALSSTRSPGRRPVSGFPVTPGRLRARYPRAGNVGTPASREGPSRASFQQRIAICKHSLNRAPSRSRHRASVGSVGDSYDKALAEAIDGFFKAAVIHRRSLWRRIKDVELATLHWVGWFNHHWQHPGRRGRTRLLPRPSRQAHRRAGLKPSGLRNTGRGSSDQHGSA